MRVARFHRTTSDYNLDVSAHMNGCVRCLLFQYICHTPYRPPPRSATLDRGTALATLACAHRLCRSLRRTTIPRLTPARHAARRAVLTPDTCVTAQRTTTLPAVHGVVGTAFSTRTPAVVTFPHFDAMPYRLRLLHLHSHLTTSNRRHALTYARR